MSILDRHSDKWTPEPNSGCFLWFGAHYAAGYGIVKKYGESPKGVHRLVCEEANGPAPEGADASHKCNVTACVNPAHLAWESRSDNLLRRTPEKASAGGKAGGSRKRLGGGKGVWQVGRRWRAHAPGTYLGYFDTEAEGWAARDAALLRIREGIA